MADQEENDESPLARLARLNRVLREWTDAPTQSLRSDDARRLGDAVEALLTMIDDIRQHPATRTPERLRALADAINALLADIAETPNPPH
jgi:hypothetical protein